MKINFNMLVPPGAKTDANTPCGVLLLHKDELNDVLDALDDENVLWGNCDKPSKFDRDLYSSYYALFFYHESSGNRMYYESFVHNDGALEKRFNEHYKGQWFTVDEVTCDKEPVVALDLSLILSGGT